MPKHSSEKRISPHGHVERNKAAAVYGDLKEVEETKETESEEKQNDASDHDGEEKENRDAPDAEAVPEPAPSELPFDAMRQEPVLTWLVVESYEGSTDENGFFDGEGFAKLKGDHWYKGNFKKGEMDGQGVYCWSDGTMYAGDFTGNKINGKGVYSWNDGSIYEGEVAEGLRHGTGTYKCGTCPSVYTGDWVHGKRHGNGTLFFDQECKTYYKGEWVKNKKQGNGLHKYRSGNVYEGDWHDNIRHGQGTMYWYDKDEEYSGQWVNGIQNGKGKHTWYFKRVSQSQYPMRNEYAGDFVKGLRCGHGTFYYAGGARYVGEWKNNLKHGKGKFIFKNGSVYSGTFEDDHMVDFPNLVPSRMTTPEIAESGIPIRSQTPIKPPTLDGDKAAVDVVLDINLSQIFHQEKIDVDLQDNELENVIRVVLRYITPFKHIYRFYSGLGHEESRDNTFVMTRLQFWRFLKDCLLHESGVSLSDMDRAGGIDAPKDEEVHSASTLLFIRDFINATIHISHLIYKQRVTDNSARISKCLTLLIEEKMLLNACIVKGKFFCDSQKTQVVMQYISRSNEVFDYFTKPRAKVALDKIVTMRDFIFILKDFHLISSSLSSREIVKILHSESPSVIEEGTYNMESEITFLEFLETLVQASQLFVTEKILKGSQETLSPRRNIEQPMSPTDQASLAKDKDDFVSGVNTNEPLQSPTNAPSPDKSVNNLQDGVSLPDGSKGTHSPTSKTHDMSVISETKHTSQGKRDHHSSKDTSSVPSSRQKERKSDKQEKQDLEDKVQITGSGKSKDKDKEKKDKNGQRRSPKKGTISTEHVATKHTIDTESDAPANVPPVSSAPDKDIITAPTSQSEVVEARSSPSKDFAGLIIPDVSSELQDDFQDTATCTGMPFSPTNRTSIQGLFSPEHGTIDKKQEDGFSVWASKVQIFLEDYFFPAFERRKEIDQKLKLQAKNSI